MSGSIVFLWVGKTSAGYARAGEADYLGRIRRYADARTIVVRQERHDGRYSPEHRLEREGRRVLERIAKLEPAYVVVLDPDGRGIDSRKFAELVRTETDAAGRNLVIVVGGPDGISCAVRDRADRTIGLSAMTFPHDMARLIILEQAYRAMTIIHGHPYDR